MARAKCGCWWRFHGAVLRGPLASSLSLYVRASYSANDISTPLTVAHHIACALPDATSRQSILQDHTVSPLLQSRLQLLAEFAVFILAMKCVLDKLAAILE